MVSLIALAGYACGHDNTSPAPVATQIVFMTLSTSAVAGAPITPSIVVMAKDVHGNDATSFTGAVSLALGTNPGGSTLSGTTTVGAIAGVATFNAVSLDKSGTGYTLVASSGALTSATSAPLSVVAGSVALLAKTGGDAQTGSGSFPLSTPLSVTVTDRLANAVAGVTVNWSVVTGGGTFGTATTVTNSLGVAANTWTLGSSTGTQTAAATVSGLSGASATFTATARTLIFASMTGGRYHTCGLTIAGAAYCWGHNIAGQLGDGTTTMRLTPMPVATTLTFASLTAGAFHTCGVTAGGAAYCWGDNFFGELGDGTTTERHSPAPVLGSLTFASLNAGADGTQTCGLSTSGTAYCWGDNSFGALGDATTTQRLTPTLVTGQLAFTTLSGGRHHTCGLVAGGAAYCWGDNIYGELGDGTAIQRNGPTSVVGGFRFTSLARAIAGVNTCALIAGGTAYCWGFNDDGELGDGTTTGRTTPTPVAGGLSFTALAVAAFHTCGLTGGNVTYCWGRNSSGVIGDGTLTQRLTPTTVAGALVFTSITIGAYHTCALTAGGAAYCWGDNYLGALGDGTQTNRSVPTAVLP